MLQWHGQADQCLQVCNELIFLEELLWVEEQRLQPAQRLGSGSRYVLHSSGWVTLTTLGNAQLRLPACLPATAPAWKWRTEPVSRLQRRAVKKLGWLRRRKLAGSVGILSVSMLVQAGVEAGKDGDSYRVWPLGR